MKRLLLFLLLLFPAFAAMSQVCLEGMVHSDTLHLQIDNAVIYFPELGISSSSDQEGKFRMCGLPKGNFRMQVKSMGHKVFISTVALKDSIQEIDIPLSFTSIEYPEIVIYGTQSSRSEETPNNITPLSAFAMRQSGAFSLSDGIAKMPGVSQLSTGAGISKPVIRGLFGNRVQTVLMGMRFDNQQWQDEHGLGLSDVGIDRIEIIKGPASLLYGSEAMGGVLNIIEEKPAPEGKTIVDVSTRFFSNTLGNATDVGIRKAREKNNWRLRVGGESHADYTDGNNFRVFNSRFDGYYAKGTWGHTAGRWTSTNNYLFSVNNFGFLMEPSMVFATPDARMSRSFDNPHHTVFVNLFTSQNTFYLQKSKLKLNLGAHLNNRQEQEGGSRISLNMLLNTYSANALWIKDLGEHTEFNIGTQDMYQTNKNVGSRTIVPDANLFESSAFVYIKHSRKYFFTEGGARYDWKNIATFGTGTINTETNNPGNTVLPFNRSYTAFNGSVGISLFDSKHWNFKLNASSGYRAGNLAELSSNGLHEGTLRYEIGDIDLKIEQNICADAYLAYDNKNLTVSGSAYINRFLNYIYLAPTITEYLGFQIFRYIQKNAALQGVESALTIHPDNARWLVVKTAYSGIVGKTDDGEFLPFVPAQKINSEIKVLMNKKGKFNSTYVRAGTDYIFDQNSPGQFETPTPSYYLINAGLGFSIENKKNQMDISVSGNNLLNKAYYDHLSRFKYFNIYNMGRNICLNFKITFN